MGLVGQEKALAFARRWASRLSRGALLVSGRKATGKTTLLKETARMLLQHPDVSNIANSPSFAFISGDQATRESLAALSSFANSGSLLGLRRVVCIDRVDLLSGKNQNILLKLTEDKNQNVFILFSAENKNSIIRTLQDRCYQITLDSLRIQDQIKILQAKGIQDSEISSRLELFSDFDERTTHIDWNEIKRNKEITLNVWKEIKTCKTFDRGLYLILKLADLESKDYSFGLMFSYILQFETSPFIARLIYKAEHFYRINIKSKTILIWLFCKIHSYI